MNVKYQPSITLISLTGGRRVQKMSFLFSAGWHTNVRTNVCSRGPPLPSIGIPGHLRTLLRARPYISLSSRKTATAPNRGGPYLLYLWLNPTHKGIDKLVKLLSQSKAAKQYNNLFSFRLWGRAPLLWVSASNSNGSANHVQHTTTVFKSILNEDPLDPMCVQPALQVQTNAYCAFINSDLCSELYSPYAVDV